MSLLKFADDNQLEQAFFQLAYASLQDKAKALIKCLVGFEIINKTDDSTKATGVFGFRSNKGRTFFVPCFFINGALKNLDLLYSKSNEQFYPLNDDFCDLLINDEVNNVGSPSKETRQNIQSEGQGGNTLDLVRPPRTGKVTYASYEGNDLFKEMLPIDQVKTAAENSDLLTYVASADNATKQAFRKYIEESAGFTESLLRFYPIEKIAEAVSENRPGKSYRKDNGVKIWNTGERHDFSSLDGAQKEMLATQGFIILDGREDSKKSKFTNIRLKTKFTNPDENGFYPYLTKQGLISHALIITKPFQLALNFITDDSIVINLGGDEEEKGTAYLKPHKQVFVKEQIFVEDYSDVYKMFENPADVKPDFDSTYILINESLKATQPFKVVANFKDHNGVRRLTVEPYSAYEPVKNDLGRTLRGVDRPGSAHNLPLGNFFTPPEKKHRINLVMTKSTGTKFTINSDTTYVPAGFKLLQINLKKPYGDGENVQKWVANEPGGIDCLESAFYSKNIFPMTVRRNGSQYFASIKDVVKKFDNERMAKISMVQDYGLDIKEAFELIDSLKGEDEANTKVQGHLKISDTGAYPAQPIEEVPYVDEFGTPTTTGVGISNQAPIDNTYTQDPTRMGLGVRPDIEGLDQDIEKAEQLSANGQKSVFDTHTISVLAKYVRPSDKINEYIPTFLAALDELGRLLFLSHSEIDKFIELYGRDDLPKFVELLSDVFRNLGDLVVFLKRKSPEISINSGKKDVLDV